MSKTKKYGFLMVASLLLGRWGWVQAVGYGGGQSVTSPSMAYRAHAQHWEGQTFFGADRYSSRLWLTDHRDREIWSMTLEGRRLDWQADGAVRWAENSSSVRYLASGASGDVVEIVGPTLPAMDSVEQATADLPGVVPGFEPPGHDLDPSAEGEGEPDAGDAEAQGPRE